MTLLFSRRMRAFQRWMKSQGIQWSTDALELLDSSSESEGISVLAIRDIKEGEVVSTIPKAACLTIKTTAARTIIESSGFSGCLGLSFAIMYERSLGHLSSWAPYLHLLPHRLCLPLLWTVHDVDRFLIGTELHKIVKQDKALIYDDWNQNILPLLESYHHLNPAFFGLEQYFSARSLIASRAFQIDDFHGIGMVPLADLFNHKTGAEDVHFTCTSSDSDSESESNDADENDDGSNNDESFTKIAADDSKMLEMIMIKDVKAGNEVYNMYGSAGNAGLLHRYGFTEPDNLFDILNIDLDIVLQWCSSSFSSRYSRARLALWRKLDYCGCISENAEYFEISYDGDPQVELLVLLYIMLLPEDDYCKLDMDVSIAAGHEDSISMILSEKINMKLDKGSELNKKLLLTKDVCDALLSLADIRESLYGSSSIKDDIKALERCSEKERKLYNSLMLRVSERRILEKLRNFAAVGSELLKTTKRSTKSKRLKRT